MCVWFRFWLFLWFNELPDPIHLPNNVGFMNHPNSALPTCAVSNFLNGMPLPQILQSLIISSSWRSSAIGTSSFCEYPPHPSPNCTEPGTACSSPMWTRRFCKALVCFRYLERIYFLLILEMQWLRFAVLCVCEWSDVYSSRNIASSFLCAQCRPIHGWQKVSASKHISDCPSLSHFSHSINKYINQKINHQSIS